MMEIVHCLSIFYYSRNSDVASILTLTRLCVEMKYILFYSLYQWEPKGMVVSTQV